MIPSAWWWRGEERQPRVIPKPCHTLASPAGHRFLSHPLQALWEPNFLSGTLCLSFPLFSVTTSPALLWCASCTKHRSHLPSSHLSSPPKVKFLQTSVDLLIHQKGDHENYPSFLGKGQGMTQPLYFVLSEMLLCRTGEEAGIHQTLPVFSFITSLLFLKDVLFRRQLHSRGLCQQSLLFLSSTPFNREFPAKLCVLPFSSCKSEIFHGSRKRHSPDLGALIYKAMTASWMLPWSLLMGAAEFLCLLRAQMGSHSPGIQHLE